MPRWIESRFGRWQRGKRNRFQVKRSSLSFVLVARIELASAVSTWSRYFFFPFWTQSFKIIVVLKRLNQLSILLMANYFHLYLTIPFSMHWRTPQSRNVGVIPLIGLALVLFCQSETNFFPFSMAHPLARKWERQIGFEEKKWNGKWV